MDNENLKAGCASAAEAADATREATKPAGTEQALSPEEAQEAADRAYMARALALAHRAAEMDEVPVGALIVQGDRIIAEACNTRETSRCATHHAEILAIEEACRTLGGWRLPSCTLYVTLEPCPMCAGAIVNARIDRVVFGARDERAGACGSVVNLNDLPLNHKMALKGGVCREECRDVLASYFRAKRKKPAKAPAGSASE